MKLNAQQHFEQLNLYGLVQGMSLRRSFERSQTVGLALINRNLGFGYRYCRRFFSDSDLAAGCVLLLQMIGERHTPTGEK
jgi:hypothetical protein